MVIEEHPEVQASIERLRELMKDTIHDVLLNDARLRDNVSSFLGPDSVEDIWVLIYDYFQQHDYVGVELPKDQIWLVD